MAVGWNGPDPIADADATAYELGTEYLVNTDITITGVRIWADVSEINLAGRTATIWTTGAGVLATVSLPTDLPTGWTVFPLTVPLTRTAGSHLVVSYGTGGNEGAAVHALDGDVVSADGAVTALSAGNATGGRNGRFHVGAGVFPTAGNNGNAFYGADISYTVGIGGNTPPVVTGVDLVDVDGTVTATAHVTDVDTLVGSSIRFDWGDGSSVSAVNWPTVTTTHTYSASGLYAVLVSCTDADSAVGYRAGAVEVTVPPDLPDDGFDIVAILDAITSHAAALGPFEAVVTHEPKAATAGGLTGAVWVNQIDLVPTFSGLAESAVRVQFVLRLYDNMLREPQDSIDPDMTRVVNDLFVAYHQDFTLNGVVTEIDLLGSYGEGLYVRSGYIRQDNKLMRAMSIYLPVIVAAAFTQHD
jgi:hypothetical protein